MGKESPGVGVVPTHCRTSPTASVPLWVAETPVAGVEGSGVIVVFVKTALIGVSSCQSVVSNAVDRLVLLSIVKEELDTKQGLCWAEEVERFCQNL